MILLREEYLNKIHLREEYLNKRLLQEGYLNKILLREDYLNKRLFLPRDGYSSTFISVQSNLISYISARIKVS